MFEDLPLWFTNKCTSLTNTEKSLFLKNFYKEPSLHIVFKDANKLKNFEEDLIKTSNISGFLKKKKRVFELRSFKEGEWWVQDFSSFFPLQNLQVKEKNKTFLDVCAAPGGKSFQILSNKHQLVLNDKNKNRIEILKSNLNRLKFNTNILNKDFDSFKEDDKYDFIIIDAPCSAVGTIRKNPEIFFKNKSPNFEELLIIQKKMLNKASNLLNKNGLIIYMVCSFLKCETEDQIKRFLGNKINFKLLSFDLLSENIKYSKIISKNFMKTLPETIFKYNIDGYFAAYIKKIK